MCIDESTREQVLESLFRDCGPSWVSPATLPFYTDEEWIDATTSHDKAWDKRKRDWVSRRPLSDLPVLLDLMLHPPDLARICDRLVDELGFADSDECTVDNWQLFLGELLADWLDIAPTDVAALLGAYLSTSEYRILILRILVMTRSAAMVPDLRALAKQATSLGQEERTWLKAALRTTGDPEAVLLSQSIETT